MKFKLNPITGRLDIAGSSTGGSSFIEDIVFKTSADTVLEIDKINWVTPTGTHSIALPTANVGVLGKVLVVNNRTIHQLTITGSNSPIVLEGVDSIVGIVCVTNGSAYGWETFSRYNIGDTNFKLDLDGGNANQDIDIDGFGVNAKHLKVTGTHGAGHIGLKHQSANISASASESSIGADSVGDPVWKNDGGAIDKLELQSNKTGTVTGNEASTSKYLTVKGVYDWAVALFAPKASPTFTGTVTTPDIVVSGATINTIAHFDGSKNIESLPLATYPNLTELSYVKGVTSALQTQINAKLSGSGLTTDYILYWNGTNLVSTSLERGANYIVSTTQAVVGKTISGGNSSYTGRYTQASHPDLYGSDTMQAVILNSMAKGLHLYNAGLFMPYIQSSGWISRTTGTQKYHDGQDFGGGNNPSWNYSGPYPEGVYHCFATNNTLTECSEAYVTVNGSGNVTLIEVIKPSNTGLAITFSIVSNKLNIATANNSLIALFKYIGPSYTTSQRKNATYSGDGLTSYWSGSLGIGHTSQNASAIFQADSTTKGSLVNPRMTTTQKLAIASPATGLEVFDTTLNVPQYYNGTAWVSLLSGSVSSGFIPYYNGSSLVDSKISDNGTTTNITGDVTINPGNQNPVTFKLYNRLSDQYHQTVFETTGNTGRFIFKSNSGSQAASGDFVTIDGRTNGGGSFNNQQNTLALFTSYGAFGGGSTIPISLSMAINSGAGSTTSNGVFVTGTVTGISGIGKQYGLRTQLTSTATGGTTTLYGLHTKVSGGQTNYALFSELGLNYFADTVSIGALSPNASAIFQVDSTTKGSLATPRMTEAQRVAIVSPVAGLIVYQTDVHAGYWYHDGTIWQDLSQPRVGTTASSATPTINTDVTDYYEITGQTVDITSFTTNLTGTPVRGQKLWIDITGTAARAITWGASFEASTIALPTTTVSTDKLSVDFIWNVATSKWRCIGAY